MPALETPAAPAPSTPTAPPVPPADTPTERPPSEWLADIGSELADLDAGKPPPPPAPRERDDKGKFKPADKPAPKAPAKPAEREPEKAVEKPLEKPREEEKPDEAQEARAPEVKPVKAAELRNAYEGLKRKVREELEPEIQKLRSRVEEYETKAPEATGPVLAKLKSLEERNKALEERMELVDFQESDKYQKEYEAPYNEMWAEAVSGFNQLSVREPAGTDEATGEPKYQARRATENDLIKLGSLPLSDLDEQAQAMFGASAPRAIGYVEELRKLARKKQRAIEEARGKAAEWKSQRTLEDQNRAQITQKTWAEVNKSLAEKFPKAFQIEEGDADDKASHTKGFALADLMFLGGESLTPEQVEALPAGFRDTVKAKKPLSDIQRVQLHALARLKMANHDRKLAQVKKLQARVAELEKTVADYEKSEPSADKAGESTAPVSNKDWLETVGEELKAMDR